MDKSSIAGSVMVVGGGIAGIQAALDLADTGFYVHMVEKSPAIGGVMAALDKTFPTNDCSMCILSPKLVECGRHTNINLMTLTEIESISGEEGNFTVKLKKHPRYVDMDKCVGCGVCAQKCPKKVPNEYNQGLNKRKAIYVPYAQAVPLKYTIDRKACIYFKMIDAGKKGRCNACVKFCENDAINFDDQEEIIKVQVGSIILAPGFACFDPSIFPEYSYQSFPNVVTSMDFERILGATGPSEGHLVRMSDHKEPKKIAWLQCVGSRNINKCDRAYCSAVCCMYAIKEAVIAKEHSQEPLDAAIFYMDMRTYGKDFEAYYNRAEKEMGIRFIRCRIHTIDEVEDNNLRIRYVQEDGTVKEEIFDMVVLSVGLEPSKDAIELAKKTGIELDQYGFARTSSFKPVATSVPGIYAAGAFQGPKDIPYSVMEASAGAAASSTFLAPARGTLTKTKEFPPERDVSEQEPRVGVFVCNCGINIGGFLNVPEVVKFAKTLPNVVYVEDNLFTCSQDTQDKMAEVIKEQGLNRVVVAACSPRTHEVLFQETMLNSGLNKYLFEMANIRNHCSWVHQSERDDATEKAKDMVAMAVAKVALLKPLQPISIGLTPGALVVGGGVAGMVSGLTMADQGFKVDIVEKKDRLGGHALKVRKSFKGEEVAPYVAELVQRVTEHENITVHLSAELESVHGFVGNFESTLSTGAKIEHGVVVVASGAGSSDTREYLYGQNPNVLKWFELDEKIENDPASIKAARSAVFIQCVGSRDDQRPYCSKICCTHAIKNAIELKELNPDMDVYVLYRDIRTYGMLEEIYEKARRMGILFIRYDLKNKPEVKEVNGKLEVTVTDPILGRPVVIEPDFITLSTAIVPKGTEKVAQMLKVPINTDKFFVEAHAKLRPVDFATDGVFLCGLAHYPKPIDESIAQAQAAAIRAMAVLTQEAITMEPIVATMIDREACRGCGLCVALCPYNALDIEETDEGRKVKLITAACKGCGVCAATCYRHAITINSFSDEQFGSQIKARFGA
ncbi:MAG: CoB--CoM heterodisulfide reductase iron-sulfur subunit A family protein [Deltaproteobacteria bacterium]|nr:CoB--CoM heterodisulfide reductase iron-sulfur subunit A family protein [Deltaproteobacteria bacterium]MBW2020286.1 CoB--CoM heterodisulfide reductase iron-sulfur subunit A family protein [Deltaproteobacteria bacterium]MBW2074769.1 CoB--CoM heterodisulfide reductase iron-sulfur subunit A family protein [Deltaproteobacteria bacterium]